MSSGENAQVKSLKLNSFFATEPGFIEWYAKKAIKEQPGTSASGNDTVVSYEPTSFDGDNNKDDTIVIIHGQDTHNFEWIHAVAIHKFQGQKTHHYLSGSKSPGMKPMKIEDFDKDGNPDIVILSAWGGGFPWDYIPFKGILELLKDPKSQ